LLVELFSALGTCFTAVSAQIVVLKQAVPRNVVAKVVTCELSMDLSLLIVSAERRLPYRA
jgi:hypothetical protein